MPAAAPARAPNGFSWGPPPSGSHPVRSCAPGRAGLHVRSPPLRPSRSDRVAGRRPAARGSCGPARRVRSGRSGATQVPPARRVCPRDLPCAACGGRAEQVCVVGVGEGRDGPAGCRGRSRGPGSPSSPPSAPSSPPSPPLSRPRPTPPGTLPRRRDPPPPVKAAARRRSPCAGGVRRGEIGPRAGAVRRSWVLRLHVVHRQPQGQRWGCAAI